MGFQNICVASFNLFAIYLYVILYRNVYQIYVENGVSIGQGIIITFVLQSGNESK